MVIIRSIRYFIGPGWPDIFKPFGVAGTNRRKVMACFGKADFTIRSIADFVGILLGLAIILPEADRADLPLGRFGYRTAMTTGAGKIHSVLHSGGVKGYPFTHTTCFSVWTISTRSA